MPHDAGRSIAKIHMFNNTAISVSYKELSAVLGTGGTVARCALSSVRLGVALLGTLGTTKCALSSRKNSKSDLKKSDLKKSDLKIGIRWNPLESIGFRWNPWESVGIR